MKVTILLNPSVHVSLTKETLIFGKFFYQKDKKKNLKKKTAENLIYERMRKTR